MKSVKPVNMHDAKTHLSKLVEKAQRGEEVIIAKSGHPVAKIVAYHPPKRKIAPPGSMEGEGRIADDFNEPIDDLFDALKEGDGEDKA